MRNAKVRENGPLPNCGRKVSWAIAYFVFYSGNLLNNYCPSDDLANVARFVFAFTIILTYPIQVFISREVGYLLLPILF